MGEYWSRFFFFGKLRKLELESIISGCSGKDTREQQKSTKISPIWTEQAGPKSLQWQTWQNVQNESNAFCLITVYFGFIFEEIIITHYKFMPPFSVSEMFPVDTTPEKFWKPSGHRLFWICVWRELGQGKHRITVTLSFTKSSIFKMFPWTPKSKTGICTFLLRFVDKALDTGSWGQRWCRLRQLSQLNVLKVCVRT